VLPGELRCEARPAKHPLFLLLHPSFDPLHPVALPTTGIEIAHSRLSFPNKPSAFDFSTRNATSTVAGAGPEDGFATAVAPRCYPGHPLPCVRRRCHRQLDAGGSRMAKGHDHAPAAHGTLGGSRAFNLSRLSTNKITGAQRKRGRKKGETRMSSYDSRMDLVR